MTQTLGWSLAIVFGGIVVIGIILAAMDDPITTPVTPPEVKIPTTPEPKSNVTMGGEFPSIKSCLSNIEAKAGPLKIMKDTPNEILGYTAAGKMFSCKRVESGSKGTYYTGWYIVAE